VQRQRGGLCLQHRRERLDGGANAGLEIARMQAVQEEQTGHPRIVRKAVDQRGIGSAGEVHHRAKPGRVQIEHGANDVPRARAHGRLRTSLHLTNERVQPLQLLRQVRPIRAHDGCAP
jgi:hypothetical protein